MIGLDNALTQSCPALPERQLASERLARVASFLTNPCCFTREHWVLAKLPTMTCVQQAGHRLSALVWGALGLLTTLPGIGLRKLGICLREHDYLYQRSVSVGFEPSSAELTTLFWNICGVPAGYALTDGGVLPWRERHAAVIGAIEQSKADVLCLMEVLDTDHAHALIRDLGASYSHFYHTVGQRSIGASSGLFVASKHSLQRFRFETFDTVSGRSTFSSKGFVSFEVVKTNAICARVLFTHASHSEAPQYPTERERTDRRDQYLQMALRAQELAQDGLPLLIGGDFNAGWDELNTTWFAENCQHAETEATWGGDGICVALRGGQRSEALCLDHVFIANANSAALRTQLLETGFEGDEFQSDVLSDHCGLLTTLEPN